MLKIWFSLSAYKGMSWNGETGLPSFSKKTRKSSVRGRPCFLSLYGFEELEVRGAILCESLMADYIYQLMWSIKSNVLLASLKHLFSMMYSVFIATVGSLNVLDNTVTHHEARVNVILALE